MDYLKAFIVGGLICAVGQILIDKTKLTPARILVTFVVVGVFLQLIKIYQPLVDFAGAGAIPPDAAVKPPVNIPKKPFSETAFSTPLQRLYPKPVNVTVAPAPAKSTNG